MKLLEDSIIDKLITYQVGIIHFNFIYLFMNLKIDLIFVINECNAIGW